MKRLLTICIILVGILQTSNSFAAVNANFSNAIVSDSTNLLATFSLFNEYQKNKDFQSASPYGWTIINTDPTQFVRYKLFPKMEEVLWYMHDSTTSTPEEKAKLTDTTLYFYDKAVQYDSEKAGYYMVRKAYVLETWKEAAPDVVVKAYEDAFAKEPNIDDFYKDRLGLYYIKNATDQNEYKLKALELYSALAEKENDNPVWNTRMESIADNPEQLMDISKKAWDFDKANLEKAWKYASVCLRNQEYEKSLEPLEFLVAKAPDVINYWKQLAMAYDKLNQDDKAIKAYKKLIEMQPDSRDNYLNIALIYKRLDQLSVARTYLLKASSVSPDWDYPVLVEAQLYEQSARSCDFDFMAKCVYLLAVNTYRKAAGMSGQFAATAADRVRALANSIPTKEDFFFRKLKTGDSIKIEGSCYDWIGRTVNVP